MLKNIKEGILQVVFYVYFYQKIIFNNMELFHQERVEQYFEELMEHLIVEIDTLKISNVDIEKKSP